MPVKHVQAELDAREYAAFEAALAEANLSVKEGAREAILAWVRQKRWKDDPFFRLVGIAGRKGPRDASKRVDDIYDED
jgi:hypothetical protein